MDAIQQIECLQEAVYFEARSEGRAGQIAVAQVVMNRARDDRWPDNACDVVHQPWQFSYYFDGKPEVYKDLRAKNVASVVAEMVYYGAMLDITDNSLYYHTLDVFPSWSYDKIKMVQVIDNHVFWKDK